MRFPRSLAFAAICAISVHFASAATPDIVTHVRSLGNSQVWIIAQKPGKLSGPLEYRFTETSGNPGGTSSAWQTDNRHLDTGLNAATTYFYSVSVRDSSGTTLTSEPVIVTTDKTPSVYVGGAFNMTQMGEPNAAGWQQVRDFGAKLHIHPVGWRGQWDALGAIVPPNFRPKEFLYEYDIVDPRTGVDNFSEIDKVESYSMTCEAVFCNFAMLEMLDNRESFVADYTSMVTEPMHARGIPVYFNFSMVYSPDAVNRAPQLLQNHLWVQILREAGADGVGLDFPPGYWKTSQYRTLFRGFLDSAKANGIPILYETSIRNQQDVTDLQAMFAALKQEGRLPDSWNMNMWHNIDGFKPPLTPETNPDDSPAGTMTGAALMLFRAFPDAPVPDPELTDIADRSAFLETNVGPLEFVLNASDPAAVSLSAYSSNTALVPSGNITLGGSGSSRTVTVTPAVNSFGTTTITIVAEVEGRTYSTSFAVTFKLQPTIQTYVNPDAALPGSYALDHEWNWNTDGDREGWVANLQLSLDPGTPTAGVIRGTATGADPAWASPNPLNIKAVSNMIVEFRIRKQTEDNTVIELFLFPSSSDFIRVPILATDLPRDGAFHVVRIHFANGSVPGSLSRIRLDPISTTQGIGRNFELDYVRIYSSKTVVPLLSPRLELQLAQTDNMLRLSWPREFFKWALQSTSQLPEGFSDSDLEVTIEEDDYVVYDLMDAPARFYRLRSQGE